MVGSFATKEREGGIGEAEEEERFIRREGGEESVLDQKGDEKQAKKSVDTSLSSSNGSIAIEWRGKGGWEVIECSFSLQELRTLFRCGGAQGGAVTNRNKKLMSKL
jgi:hypothetical protein